MQYAVHMKDKVTASKDGLLKVRDGRALRSALTQKHFDRYPHIFAGLRVVLRCYSEIIDRGNLSEN